MKKWAIYSKLENKILDKLFQLDDIKFLDFNFDHINKINLQRLISQLLFNRGINTKEDVLKFFNLDYEASIYDPFIFIDMEKACDRICQAIINKEKILVYGDYDADGVSSSVLLVSLLKDLGGDVDIYIPHREIEGYGFNNMSINLIKDKRFNLVITVDTGISSVEEVAFLQKNKIDVIVTDHHAQPKNLPKAFCLINPQLEREKYPFQKLAGVGVAFKLAQGLLRFIKKNKIKKLDNFKSCVEYEKSFLDLVAIGTVADCMPLLDENRILVKLGLEILKQTKRRGLEELINHSGIDINNLKTYHIGFQIGPRINAAGRLEHANLAYQLLISNDIDECCRLSEKLNKTNTERQLKTDFIVNLVKKNAHKSRYKNIIFAIGEDWPVGIVGLVAGKLVEYFNRPVVIMTHCKNSITGSGRSVEPFDMIGALQKLDHYFLTYGGHKMACGFTLKNPNDLENFQKDFDKLAGQSLQNVEVVSVIKIDAEIDLEDLSFELVNLLKLFSPFGKDNEEPCFIVRNLKILDIQILGKTEKHLRFVLEQNGIIIKAIAFGFADVWKSQLRKGDLIDVVCNVFINEWNGFKEIQLKIIDLKFS